LSDADERRELDLVERQPQTLQPCDVPPPDTILRGLADDQQTPLAKEGRGALGGDGRSPECSGDDDVGFTATLSVAADLLGPAMVHHHPLGQAQPPHRPAEELAAALVGVEQAKAGRGPVARQHEPWEATSAPEINYVGDRVIADRFGKAVGPGDVRREWPRSDEPPTLGLGEHLEKARFEPEHDLGPPGRRSVDGQDHHAPAGILAL